MGLDRKTPHQDLLANLCFAMSQDKDCNTDYDGPFGPLARLILCFFPISLRAPVAAQALPSSPTLAPCRVSPSPNTPGQRPTHSFVSTLVMASHFLPSGAAATLAEKQMLLELCDCGNSQLTACTSVTNGPVTCSAQRGTLLSPRRQVAVAHGLGTVEMPRAERTHTRSRGGCARVVRLDQCLPTTHKGQDVDQSGNL